MTKDNGTESKKDFPGYNRLTRKKIESVNFLSMQQMPVEEVAGVIYAQNDFYLSSYLKTIFMLVNNVLFEKQNYNAN